MIGRHGPGFRLAQVAEEAGVAVGTVAGRFGSKQNFLLAMMTAGRESVAPRMWAAAEGRDQLAAITAAALVVTEGLDDPATTADHLGQLGVDLADAHTAGGPRGVAGQRDEVLTDLFEAAALPGAPPPEQAARVIAAMTHGALMDWSLNPRGAIADNVRADVEAVLAGWK